MTLDDLRSAFRVYPELLKIAKSIHRLDETACNYGLNERQEKAVERLEKKAQDLLDNFIDAPAEIYHQSDPRGCSLYVCKPEEANQTYYDRGIAII